MRIPRITLGAVGLTVLIVAVDLGVLREAERSGGSRNLLPVFTLWLLPMIDVLLIAGFRLRRRERRTGGAVGFFANGAAATALILAAVALASDGMIELMQVILQPVIDWIERTAPPLVGPDVIDMQAIQIALGLTEEFLLPAAVFSGPALALALLGRWIGRWDRAGVVQPAVAGETTIQGNTWA